MAKVEVKEGTNRWYAQHDGNFRKYCEKAGVTAGRRQASKFRRGMGRAYVAMLDAEQAKAR